jgi:hypothetical protein
MNPRRLSALLLFLLLPSGLQAQDAHSQAIGGAAAAGPMGLFGIIWNPSNLALTGTPSGVWTFATGFSAFDTNNANVPILHFTPDDARGASADPVQRYQDYTGSFAVQYLNMGGGVVYDQQLNYSASQGALSFFHDRDSNSLSGNYSLDLQQTSQQVGTLLLSYGIPVPLGSIPCFVGGTLKYQDGLDYQQTVMGGTFQTGGSPVTFTKTSSSSGLGLSTDLGFIAKITDSLQIGMMFENLTSNFNWQAKQQSYVLDPDNGRETPVPGSEKDFSLSAPYPYGTRLGMMATPQGQNIVLEGEVSWSQGQTRWRAGLEHIYPESNLVVRMGTFADPISNQQMWTFGLGYLGKIISVDASFVTRSLPAIQDSICLGGGIDAVARF